MTNIIDVLEAQLDHECDLAKDKLTAASLDAIYKLAGALYFMRDGAELAGKIEMLSNGVYDGNVDKLYADYMAAKTAFRGASDDGHRAKVLDALRRLMAEVHDMLAEMIADADFQSEREEIHRMMRILVEK